MTSADSRGKERGRKIFERRQSGFDGVGTVELLGIEERE